ncbi:MAG TPA: AAA family ATPase, partial [Polyangiales bacterium]
MALSATSPERGRNALISGRYRIQAELGRGGMAAVLRALDGVAGRTVALKRLESDDPRVVALFEREYYTLASLKHPRVIEVYDFGIDAGGRFYTMELLAGADLSGLAPLPYVAASAHLRDIATSLALLHARRLVHRDVSPRNIRLDAAGRAKLIDFGALASFGAIREIVGTPPFMAPEAQQRGLLDQRSDLFSLGAVAYFLLTQRLPFAIRSIEEMSEAHRVAPPPPSSLVPEVPAALDELVLSLLSIDPLGRPSSAAEVIDRLSAIAELDAEPLTGVAESHLLSSALVGRERQQAQLRQHVARAVRGAGSVVVVDGAPGMGRTRLGNELLVHARIAGVTALRVDAPANTGPNATLGAICLALSDAAPGEAARAFASHGAELLQNFPELSSRFSGATQARPWAASASERRARVQAAFAAWVLAVAEQRPLVLLIDDAHALDADSAGALVLLAHALSSAKLVLALTLPREVTLPAAVQQLTRIAPRVRLPPLDADQITLLVASVFGDVPHRARVAQWLEQTARGNPGHALELLRHLVGRAVIRYERGSWSLPAELPEQELPRGVEEALLGRLQELGATAQRLSQLLALYRAALPLRVCLELMPRRPAAEIVTALDALVARDVVVRSEDSYRFNQDALRGVVLAHSTPEQTRALHRALAHALRRAHRAAFEAVRASRASALSTSEINMVLQVATHFELCGAPSYGRRLLREAAVELTMRGDGLPDAVPVLEAAVARLRREGQPRHELAPLLVPLVLAGTYSDFRLTYRYGEEALELLLELSGIALATRLRPLLGPRLSLTVGLA